VEKDLMVYKLYELTKYEIAVVKREYSQTA
jgi:hypothetical protein